MFDNPLMNNPYRRSVLIELLLLASHKKSEFYWNNELVVLKEGQLLTGRKKLAVGSGVSESYLEKILKIFEKMGILEQQKTNKFRIITMLNWQKYQTQEQQKDNRKTTERQQKDTFNNDKELKEYKERFSFLWSAYPNKKGKADAEKKYISLAKKDKDIYTKIEQAIKRYVVECKKNKVETKFIKHGDTFFSKGWQDYQDKEPKSNYVDLLEGPIRFAE